jgi:hypothetical protein
MHSSKELRQVILPSLLVINRTVTTHIEKMSYSSYAQLNRFQQLFGSTYVVGIQPTTRMRRESALEDHPPSIGGYNVVAGNYEEFTGKKFEPFESTGIEFLHDGSQLIIKVCLIQYGDYEVLSAEHQKILGLPQEMD